MQIQIRVARGIGITIDGQRPAKRFSVGESDQGFDFHEDLGSENGVMVGGHEIKGVYFDCTIDDFNEGTNPRLLYLNTPQGQIMARVTQVREDPTDETATLVDAESI